MNRSRMWLLTLLFGLGVLPSALWVGVASADQTTYVLGVGGSAGCLVRTNWEFPPCGLVKRSNRSTIPSPSNPQNAYPWIFVVSSSDQFTRGTSLLVPPIITGTPTTPNNCLNVPGTDLYAHINFTGSVPDAQTMIADALTVGNANPGSGLGTEAVGDTTAARDSLKISVGRSGTTVTLNGFSGFLRNTLGTLRPLDSRNTITIAVYPDSNTAYADDNHTGAGANFFGQIQLIKTQKTDRLVMSGGFGPTDFVLTQGTIQNQAVPAGGLTKAVTVPSSANAVVAMTADPKVGSAAVPGASPTGLALLSLLMLGGGVWFISTRNRQRLA